MDFKECMKKKIIKQASLDHNKIKAIRSIAKQKMLSADYLPKEHIIAKITLYYDVLRELLEALALEKGYKIYNHECYRAFLKEIMNLSREGDLFDILRRVRNGINYYGKNVDNSESKQIIADLKSLIKKFSKQN